MATYTTSKTASGVAARAGIGEHTAYATFDVAVDGAGTALALNDVIQMVRIPAGATITNVVLTSDDMDTSTGIVLDVGDGSDTDRYIDGSTIGQAGGVERMNVRTGFLYEYTAEDTIDVLVQVAASGTAAVTGKIKIAVEYTMVQ